MWTKEMEKTERKTSLKISFLVSFFIFYEKQTECFVSLMQKKKKNKRRKTKKKISSYEGVFITCMCDVTYYTPVIAL